MKMYKKTLSTNELNSTNFTLILTEYIKQILNLNGPVTEVLTVKHVSSEQEDLAVHLVWLCQFPLCQVSEVDHAPLGGLMTEMHCLQ